MRSKKRCFLRLSNSVNLLPQQLVCFSRGLLNTNTVSSLHSHRTIVNSDKKAKYS